MNWLMLGLLVYVGAAAAVIALLAWRGWRNPKPDFIDEFADEPLPENVRKLVVGGR